MIENFGDKRNSNGFDKRADDAKKGGRKKKIYTILKEQGYSKEDIKNAIQELLFYSVIELEELKSQKEQLAIITLISSAILKGVDKGDFKAVKDLVEYVIGKPTGTTKIQGDPENPLNSGAIVILPAKED